MRRRPAARSLTDAAKGYIGVSMSRHCPSCFRVQRDKMIVKAVVSKLSSSSGSSSVPTATDFQAIALSFRECQDVIFYIGVVGSTPSSESMDERRTCSPGLHRGLQSLLRMTRKQYSLLPSIHPELVESDHES